MVPLAWKNVSFSFLSERKTTFCEVLLRREIAERKLSKEQIFIIIIRI